jgi:hypothetical protein
MENIKLSQLFLEEKMKKLLLVRTVIVLLFTLASCSVVSGLQSASETGNAFMQALKDNDNTTSWSMLGQNIKDEVGGEAAWADFTEPRNFSDWSFNSTSIDNSTATLEGEATLGADTYYITLIMDANGEEWLITGINIELK